MSFDIILKSTLALERLLHFLPEQDLLSLASTCQACTQAVLLYVLPSLSDVCHGLERRGVACKASLRLAFEVIRLCSVASQRQLPAASETRSVTLIISHYSKHIITRSLANLGLPCSSSIFGTQFEYVKDNVLPITLTNCAQSKGCFCPPHL